ncbi:MAG: zinc ribbon domain-containing protein [Clostridia bacterium]|nr:zinc ribbon domain-containing protein [Clostridia bacterium]
MYCENCGSFIEDGKKFCSECGAPAPTPDELENDVSEPEAIENKPIPSSTEDGKTKPSTIIDSEPLYTNPAVSQQGNYSEPPGSYQSAQSGVYTEPTTPVKKKGLVEKFKGLSKGKKILVIAIAIIILLMLFGKGKKDDKPDTKSAVPDTQTTVETTTKAVTYSNLTLSGITFSIPSTFESMPSVGENYYDFGGVDRAGIRFESTNEPISDNDFNNNKSVLCSNMDNIANMALTNCKRTSEEYFNVDGLKALRCKYTGLDEGEASNVEIVFINNPDNGSFVTVWTMFYEDYRDKYYAEYEKLLKGATVDKTVTTKKQETTVRTGIDPNFKAFWDGYERFIDSYVKIMKDPSAIYSLEYLNMLSEYAEWMEKIDDYEDTDGLTNEEIAYMTEVQARVATKMVGVAVS